MLLRPACGGTGIKAGAAARAVLELAGVHNILTKVFGSTNPINAVKATFEALRGLRPIRRIEELRGVALRKVAKRDKAAAEAKA